MTGAPTLLSVIELKPTDLLLIAGLTLVAAWFVLRFVRQRGRRTGGSARSPILTPAEQLERMRQERGVRGDLEGLMVEIEQLAKRLGAQLDAKSVQLERLLREADERIARLQRLQDDAGAPRADAPSAASGRIGAAARSENSPPGGRAGAASRSPGGDTPSDDPLARSVYDLADAGHAPTEIARRLGEHVGKVELILALRVA